MNCGSGWDFMQILYTIHARMTFLMSLVKLRQVLIILCYVFYNATVFPYNKFCKLLCTVVLIISYPTPSTCQFKKFEARQLLF